MDDQQKENILEKYYFEEQNPAAFGEPQKLWKVLDRKYPGVFTIDYVRQWLSNQDS